MELADDAPLVRLFRGLCARALGRRAAGRARRGLPPRARGAYDQYLSASDELADGPTRRFLTLSAAEKRSLIDDARDAAALERVARGDDAAGERDARAWVAAVAALLDELGDVGLEAPAQIDVPRVIAPGREFSVPTEPGRDHRYFRCAFYWPDALDPNLPAPTGAGLQLRVAISHLNEVWAVETGGAMLSELADELGWEFLLDAARWTYDEARHMLMGQRRVESWGLDLAHVPLGRYIYDAVARAAIRSTASACSASSRPRTSARSTCVPVPSARWAIASPSATCSSTGPTRRSTPSTGAAG